MHYMSGSPPSGPRVGRPDWRAGSAAAAWLASGDVLCGVCGARWRELPGWLAGLSAVWRGLAPPPRPTSWACGWQLGGLDWRGSEARAQAAGPAARGESRHQAGQRATARDAVCPGSAGRAGGRSRLGAPAAASQRDLGLSRLCAEHALGCLGRAGGVGQQPQRAGVGAVPLPWGARTACTMSRPCCVGAAQPGESSSGMALPSYGLARWLLHAARARVPSAVRGSRVWVLVWGGGGGCQPASPTRCMSASQPNSASLEATAPSCGTWPFPRTVAAGEEPCMASSILRFQMIHGY
jgi:hypothetical protein